VNDARSRRRARVLLGATAIALACAVLVSTRGLAADGCAITVDGVPLNSATTSSAAIELRLDDAVELQATSTSRQAITRYSVAVIVADRLVPIYDAEGLSATALTAKIQIKDYAPSAGLFEIAVSTNLCTVRGWIRLRTQSPFDTPAGLIAVGGMAGGALVVVSGLARQAALLRRPRLPRRASIAGARSTATAFRSLLWGHGVLPFVGGAVLGGGVLLYKQQTGEATLSTDSLLSWTVLPGFASVGSQAVISGVVGVVRTTAREVLSAEREGTSAPPAPPMRPAADVSAPPVAATSAASTVARPIPPVGARPAPSVASRRVPAPPSAEVAPSVAPPASVAGAGLAKAAGSTAPADPPRTSYARLDCPSSVVAATEFALLVGLTDHPDARITSEPLRRPDWSIGPYVITIQVVADGFTLRRGETWRVDLAVSAERPYPTAILHLTGDSGSVPIRASSIRAMYSIGGQPIGLAARSVAVVREASLLHTVPKADDGPGVDLTVPAAGQTAPDLTVRIEYAESQGDGRLLMQLLTSVANVAVPDAPLPIDIGRDPAADLRHVINTMSVVEGTQTQYASLRGVGLTIADQLPKEFWNVLADLKSRIGVRPPTILILSAEPYVPWELAVVDPPLDPAAPPFLSAQANVGRWVLGQRQPKLPPPATLTVGSIAVVSGTYSLPGWARLVEAEAEAADLVRTYGAATINASTTTVLELISADPCADLIHFAVHGNFDAEGIADGLILVDGKALDPLAVRGTSIHGRPFFFLNACQVGRGRQILGDSAGLASAFLFAGASAVIAPLWSIDDKVARTIALKFYEGALAGDTAADILRRERAAFRDSPETASSTYLAYQYFGHPGLRLERASSVGPASRTAATAGAR